MRIVLLGAPGSGKGTQSRRLADIYDVPQISTGDLLRNAVKSKSKIGKQVKVVLDAGELVDDDIVLGLLEERLKDADAKGGFLLDGFPRNIPQAQALDNRLKLINKPVQIAVFIEVPTEDLVARISGRYTCESCGEIYNDSTRKPAKRGVCDVCDGESFNRREDDNIKTVRARLETYEEETAPLVNYYRVQQKLRPVKGNGTAEQITKKISAVIDADLRPLSAPALTARPVDSEPLRFTLPTPPAEEEEASEEEDSKSKGGETAAAKSAGKKSATKKTTSKGKETAKKVTTKSKASKSKPVAKKKVEKKVAVKKKVEKKAAKKTAKKSAKKVSTKASAKKKAAKKTKTVAKKKTVTKKKVAKKAAKKAVAKKTTKKKAAKKKAAKKKAAKKKR